MNIQKNMTKCKKWIKDWFKNDSGNADGIIIEIDGNINSTVVGKLCVDSIGCENVYGVIVDNEEHNNSNNAISICNFLNIRYRIINIQNIFNSTYDTIKYSREFVYPISSEVSYGMKSRIHMIILYAIAQMMNYRVVGTTTASDHLIGDFIKWGNGACDFNPIENFTDGEIYEIGEIFRIPFYILDKHSMYENKLGVSVGDVDEFVVKGSCSIDESNEEIKKLFDASIHKSMPIPVYQIDCTE